MPEYGDIKIKLTLNRQGKVTKIIVTSSASVANRQYIEKVLPSLTFPVFGAPFGDAKDYTFTITLSNE